MTLTAELPGARGGAPARGAPQRPEADDGRRPPPRRPPLPGRRVRRRGSLRPAPGRLRGRPCRASTARPSRRATPRSCARRRAPSSSAATSTGCPSRTSWRPPSPPGRSSLGRERIAAVASRAGRLPTAPAPGDGSWSWTDRARPQSEVRVGHVGPPRRIDDFHALAVMNALLGGLFNSRLNRLLREERGYTYGVHSDFDMRRAAGPFSVRCAVETEVTAPAIADIMAELGRIREAPVAQDELDAARDYLVGVFPLALRDVRAGRRRAGRPGRPRPARRRAGPLPAGRGRGERGGRALQPPRTHLDPGRASIVVVGDAAAVPGGAGGGWLR